MKRWNYYREEICCDCGRLEGRWSALRRAVRQFFKSPVVKLERPLTAKELAIQALLLENLGKRVNFPVNYGANEIKIHNNRKLPKADA